MNEIFKLFGTIAIEGVQEAEKEIKDLSGTAEKSSSKIGSVFKGIGKVGATTAKVVGGAMVAAGGAVAGLVTKSTSAYAEYEQLVGGVDTLFKGSSKKVQQYAENAYKTAGMSANEYMNTVTSFSASLLQSLGGDTEAAADKADMAITDMSDNANKMGTSMESIQNAYQGFAKQNYTMLDNLKLGYGGTKEEMERLLEDAEAISGIDYDISSYADVVDAIHVIQTEMGITGTTSKEAAGTISGSMASVKSAWANLMTAMSSDDLPLDEYITKFVESASAMVDNMMPRIQKALVGVVQLINELAPVIIGKIPELLSQLLPNVISAATGIVDALASILPDAISAIVNVAPQLVSAFVQVINSIVEALPSAIQSIVAALPTLITTLVDGIFSVFNTLMSNLMPIVQPIIEAIPSLIISIVEAIKNNLPTFIQGIVSLVMGIVEAIPTIVQSLVDAIPTIVQLLIDAFLQNLPIILEGIISLVSSILEMLPTIIQTLVDAIPKIIQMIVDGFPQYFSMIIDFWISIIQMIVENLPTIIQALIDAIPTIISSIIEAIITNLPVIIDGLIKVVAALVVALPQIFMELIKAIPKIFGNIVKGIWNGIVNGLSGIGRKIIELLFPNSADGIFKVVDTIVSYFKMCVANIKQIFSVVWSVISTPFKLAWNAIKTVWNIVVDYFKMIWNNIKAVFSVVDSVLSGDFKGAWDGIKRIWSNVTGFFKNVVNHIKNAFSRVGEILTAPFRKAKDAIKNIVNNIKGFFSGLKLSFPNIKLPHFSITPSGWKIGDLLEGVIPKLGIKWYAKGGVIDSPSLIGVGEDGAEAVVPLERNTGWINKVADEVAEQINVNNSNDSILDKLEELIRRIEALKIYLYGDTLVGELVGDIDAKLGQLSKLRGRAN